MRPEKGGSKDAVRKSREIRVEEWRGVMDVAMDGLLGEN